MRDAQKLAQNVFPPWKTNIEVTYSLQSITRPFQKRFREVFGNARILNFYLSIKAWEEKSLPKSHLGWFFLVFQEGKATKENMSIFWFIWPLNNSDYCGKNLSCFIEKLAIRIFALEIRVVYFRDCTTRVFAVKIRVV